MDEAASLRETMTRRRVVSSRLLVSLEPRPNGSSLVANGCAGHSAFHSTRLILSQKDARKEDRQKHKDNLSLYFDLTQILAKSYLAGWALSLDLQEYQTVFPGVDEGVRGVACADWEDSEPVLEWIASYQTI
jgi:hypothetical protein